LHASTGTISENDVMLAVASHGIVIGFDVTVDPAARKMADSEGVDVRLYDIIYKLVEDVEKALRAWSRV
jgi:translation initiation factor IF-2